MLPERVSTNGKGITMRLLTCFGLVLATTAAHAQTYTTVVNRDTKTVTTTGPTATATTEQTNEEESEEQQAAEDDAVLAEQVRHDVIQP